MKPIQRWNHYDIVYRIPGYKKTFTESFRSIEEANIRIAEIELAKKTGTLSPPKKRVSTQKTKTVSEFFDEYVERYGKNRWGDSYYSCSIHRITHYIKPFIGDMLVKDVTTADIDDLYNTLLETPAVLTSGQKDTGKKVSLYVIDKVNCLIRSAFGKAQSWGYVITNPAIGATVPKRVKTTRAVWTPSQAKDAINLCTDSNLRVCMMLAIGCSMRIGEILGLQWSSVHITDESLAENSSWLEVKQELKRCQISALKMMEEKNRSDVFFKFPEVFPDKNREYQTTLVLKSPKTDSSIRTVYIPTSAAKALLELKERQDMEKQAAVDAYQDYDLVIAHDNGRPVEDRIVAATFKAFIKENGLPEVVFHSLRHLSTSLKLRLSGGDIKAVQGDTGHAQAAMVTEVYSHTFDENRKHIVDQMQSNFFAPVAEADSKEDAEARQLVRLLKKNPELSAMFLSMAQKMAAS